MTSYKDQLFYESSNRTNNYRLPSISSVQFHETYLYFNSKLKFPFYSFSALPTFLALITQNCHMSAYVGHRTTARHAIRKDYHIINAL